MTIEAGTVVVLKSGGRAMTVVAVDGENADCIWCGEEGDFFRETIPTVVLQAAEPIEDDEDEEEDETEEEIGAEEETDADEKDKRTAA